MNAIRTNNRFRELLSILGAGYGSLFNLFTARFQIIDSSEFYDFFVKTTLTTGIS